VQFTGPHGAEEPLRHGGSGLWTKMVRYSKQWRSPGGLVDQAGMGVVVKGREEAGQRIDQVGH
jgi:hypothetical protein